MKALLLKDFKLMKQQSFIYAAIIIFIEFISFMFTIIYLRSEFVFINIGFLTIIMAVLTINSMNQDEISNGYPFILSLPIKRQTYVIEKYILGMILGIVTMLIVWLISLIVSSNPNNRLYDFASIACLLSFPFMLIVQSFIIPLRFLAHDKKGKMAIIMILILLFGIVLIGSRILISYIYNEYYSLQIFSKMIFL